MHPRAPETDVRAAASSPVGHAARRRAAMPRTWRHASQSPAGGRSWPGHATRPRRSIPVITNPGAASKRPAPAEVFSVAGTLLSTSLDASNGNTLFARDAGGWASAKTVEETYGHTDLHDPKFMAALDRVWGGS